MRSHETGNAVPGGVTQGGVSDCPANPRGAWHEWLAVDHDAEAAMANLCCARCGGRAFVGQAAYQAWHTLTPEAFHVYLRGGAAAGGAGRTAGRLGSRLP